MNETQVFSALESASISFVFSNIVGYSNNCFIFYNITGWVAKCLKPLRVFNNITGWTFIFHARALLIDD